MNPFPIPAPGDHIPGGESAAPFVGEPNDPAVSDGSDTRRSITFGNDAQWAETLTVWQALDLTLALRNAASAAERLDVPDQPPVVLTSVDCGDRILNVGIGRSSDTGEVLVYISHGPAHTTRGAPTTGGDSARDGAD